LIPKGILAPSFLSEVLLLKFLYHVPLERIRAMVLPSCSVTNLLLLPFGDADCLRFI
jgi:hypothetical protein